MDVTISVEALSPKPGGIGRYTWELCEGLRANPHVSQLSFYKSRHLVRDPRSLVRGIEPSPSRSRLARFWQRRSVRRALSATIFHGPNYFLPREVDGGIITVHDLSVFRFPDTHPIERVQAFEKNFTDSLRRTAHVITDTETVRAELIADFGISPVNVTSVPLGVETRFAPRSGVECQTQLDRWGLSYGEYGLCISTLEPRKGIAGLIAAWRRLPPETRQSRPLVLAGGTGWRNENLLREIRDAQQEGWLRHLGFVDERDLPFLYAGAAAFAYPSIYEGFGLPPLEAMASGIPVIVSNRSCMPEVCGDAALLFDPENPSDLDRAIVKSLFDNAWRIDAITRGLDRAATFTWARCIERTVDVYRHVARKR